jgi:hypothetical protein
LQKSVGRSHCSNPKKLNTPGLSTHLLLPAHSFKLLTGL